MERQVFEDLCEQTGYEKGKLTFRYLEVSISSKKLTVVVCEMLMDKIMTCGVKTWGSKNLSYAEIVDLVNSILLHIHSYLSIMFILPRKVMN